MMDYSNVIPDFKTGLGFLGRLGFIGSVVSVETSKVAGDSLLLRYDSRLSERQIEVSYLRAQRGRPAAIVVFIGESSGKRFSLEDWLTANGIFGAIQFSTIKTPGASEKQFIEQFFHDLEQLCDKELHEILVGRAWKDVPIDWKGYR